ALRDLLAAQHRPRPRVPVAVRRPVRDRREPGSPRHGGQRAPERVRRRRRRRSCVRPRTAAAANCAFVRARAPARVLVARLTRTAKRAPPPASLSRVHSGAPPWRWGRLYND
ncbi:MAG: hypothetical protein BJ554DRAFT_4257, partial [Olpidium bornovanus]